MAKTNVCTAEDRTNISIINEEGIMALAFACLGQDAGVPGKPYIRIFPTSVDQCFNAIHGKPLTSDDSNLDAMRAGDVDITTMFGSTEGGEILDVNLNGEETEEEKKKRETIGELGRPKSSLKIRNFLSTLLPIDVVDGIYNAMAKDERKARQIEIEARAFAARLAVAPKPAPKATKIVVDENDKDQCGLFGKVQTA